MHKHWRVCPYCAQAHVQTEALIGWFVTLVYAIHKGHFGIALAMQANIDFAWPTPIDNW